MAVIIPFGLYKWLVMLMDCHNLPAIHQQKICATLCPFIGKFCHIYLVIWSNSVAEHIQNCEKILVILKEGKMHCSPKKTDLFYTTIQFLSHIISTNGVKVDPAKIKTVAEWPTPESAMDVWSFLGLIHYVSVFLQGLANHTAILIALISKEAKHTFPAWDKSHQHVFNTIKALVLLSQCLTVINHKNPDNNEIYVTCDASNLGMGAMLSFGPSWETARLVAFDSA